MKKREQVLKFREAPICIDTAHGVIEIHRVKHDRRTVRFVLPAGLKAHIGMAQLKDRSTWVEFEGDIERAKHRLLEVEHTADGISLRPARKLSVRA
jgi:hypothetical protein